MLPGAKMLDFRIPSALSGVQNDVRNHSSGTKNGAKTQSGQLLGTDFLPMSLSEHSWPPLWSILNGLWIHLDGFDINFQ